MEDKMLSNYAFSGWIENLGVVPLFSFAFFLFFPAFLSFNFLLVSVLIVGEPIFKSLSYLINYKFRCIYLSLLPPLVKIFLTATLCTSNSYANVKKDIFISKGEQFELVVSSLKNFSVGNKEVLKYKYLPKKNIILLKGKSQGFSDLVTWDKHGNKSSFHIYVTSKREQLKKMEIAQILKGTGLKTQISGDIIYVSGEIVKESDYLIVKKLENQKLENLILNIELEHELKNKIIAKIYQELYARGFDYVSCSHSYGQILCNYQSKTEEKEYIKELEAQYQIRFQNLNQHNRFKNYQLEFKVVSVETNESTQQDSGFHRVQNNLANLIQTNQSKLATGDILLEDQDTRIKLVASPLIKTTIDQKFQLQLGGEIPFSQVQNNLQGLKWKFVGLQIKGKLELKGKQFFLGYQGHLTKPSSSGVEGPKGSSSLFIGLGSFTKLYSVKLNHNTNLTTAIPYLKRIPFLNKLFSKTNQQYGHREIIVMAKLTEES